MKRIDKKIKEFGYSVIQENPLSIVYSNSVKEVKLFYGSSNGQYGFYIQVHSGMCDTYTTMSFLETDYFLRKLKQLIKQWTSDMLNYPPYKTEKW